MPGSLDLDDFGEDEEDRKPSLEYLNSLNDYRKRSRSQENEGFSGRNKIAKTESFTNGEHVNVEVGIQGEATPKADPMVYGPSPTMRVVFLSNIADTVHQ